MRWGKQVLLRGAQVYFTFSEREYMVIDTDVDGDDSEILRNPCPLSAAASQKLKGQHPRNASDYVLISIAMCLLYSARIYRESEDLR